MHTIQFLLPTIQYVETRINVCISFGYHDCHSSSGCRFFKNRLQREQIKCTINPFFKQHLFISKYGHTNRCGIIDPTPRNWSFLSRVIRLEGPGKVLPSGEISSIKDWGQQRNKILDELAKSHGRRSVLERIRNTEHRRNVFAT